MLGRLLGIMPSSLEVTDSGTFSFLKRVHILLPLALQTQQCHACDMRLTFNFFLEWLQKAEKELGPEFKPSPYLERVVAEKINIL